MDGKQNAVYIKILVDTLQKKKEVLDLLLGLTRTQEQILAESDFSVDDFDETMGKKERLIRTLNQLDDGFEAFYQRLRAAIPTEKGLYRNELRQAQALISQITDTSVKLQAMEARNKERLAVRLTEKRQTIKKFNVNSQMAERYSHNMANQHQVGQSYFMDKRK